MPLRAIMLMVLGMAFLALSDMFIKLAAARIPVGQVMVMLSLGGTTVFYIVARIQRVPIFTRTALQKLVLLRNGMEMMGGLGMVLGIALVPLSLVAVIMQATPLLVTLGAALLLHEPVGWRRWAAIFVGLLGMLLVVRPGFEGFAPATLLVVMGVVGLAMRDLVTRMTPDHIPSIALSTWGFGATIPVGVILLLLQGNAPIIDVMALAQVGGAVLVTTSGYYAVTAAMRLAPASTVAPFRYSRLVFTMSVGILVFGDMPDNLTLTGAAIIIASGLYSFLRERRLARDALIEARITSQMP
ncbi:DMT family transporter [Primorskyibacter marinus]|uniref:DMT family transporter n=1 Tax=Primorskyibacter marinus TaxID=1977320 RepID=UPI000E303BE7|nr:DMT family transporter [Primorskyibacter marinus]